MGLLPDPARIQDKATADIIDHILPAVDAALRAGIADASRQITADVVGQIIPAVSAALAEGVGGAAQLLPGIVRQSLEGLTITATINFGYVK